MRAFTFQHTAEVETSIEAENEQEAREKFVNNDYLSQVVMENGLADPDIADLGEI